MSVSVATDPDTIALQPRIARGRPPENKETMKFVLSKGNITKIRATSKLTDVPMSRIVDNALTAYFSATNKPLINHGA